LDKLFGSFSLGFLVRRGFSGVFFVLAFCVATFKQPLSASICAKDLLTFGPPAALFAGVTLYTLSRSLIYPLIEWFMNSDLARRQRETRPLISENTIAVLRSKWKSPAGVESESSITHHLSVWGDYMHFQYTSALCIGAGALIGWLTAPVRPHIHVTLLVLALILFLAALISDWRWHRVHRLSQQRAS
jgi:hypothetical protein